MNARAWRIVKSFTKGEIMSDGFNQRVCVVVLMLAPVVLAVGFSLRPYSSNFTDTAKTAVDVSNGPLRFVWAHGLISAGLVLIILAVFAIRLHLLNEGENTWSFYATGLITIGGGMLVALTGAEGFGGYAVVKAEGQVEAFFEATEDWTWLLFVAIIVFSVGLLALAVAVLRTRVLSSARKWIVVAALGIWMIANFVLSSWATYVISFAAIVVFWLLAASVRSGITLSANGPNRTGWIKQLFRGRWAGFTRKSQVELLAAVIFFVPLLIFFLATSLLESWEFAFRVVIGQTDPTNPFVMHWASVGLAILTIFLLPVLLGIGIALMINFYAEEGHLTEAEIEDIVKSMIEEA